MQQLEALAEELDALDELLATLQPADWDRATRCAGWSVADVVLHLAQTNELARASADGSFESHLSGLSGLSGLSHTARAESVDHAAALRVEVERGAAPDELLARWRVSAETMHAALASGSPSDRLPWVAGELARRTLVTTRQAETWIHHGDVADAVGGRVEPAPRLVNIARLAWRTLPYAFAHAGRSLHGPVAMHLDGLDATVWDFEPDDPPLTTVRGPGPELCEVAARRVDPGKTRLVAEGPDAAEVLQLIRTYA